VCPLGDKGKAFASVQEVGIDKMLHSGVRLHSAQPSSSKVEDVEEVSSFCYLSPFSLTLMKRLRNYNINLKVV
jgi:hypothetical protein